MRGRRNRRQRGLAIYASSGSRRVSTNKSVLENDANSQQTSPDSPSLWPCLALVRKPALEKERGGQESSRGPGGIARDPLSRTSIKTKQTGQPFHYNQSLRPQIRRDYALNLSISLRAGKETN